MNSHLIENELRQSLIAQCLARTYVIPQLRRKVMNLVLRLEGGSFHSSTARKLLKRYHGVEVGAYSYGECFVPGAFPAGVRIGRYVSIAEGVRVFLRDHPLARRSLHPFFYNSKLGIVPEDNILFGTLTIEHDSWIGCRAIITPRCKRIGIGAVIAAGAVVTTDVPDFCIAAGVPARIVRKRFSDEICEELVKEAWWLLSISEIRPRLAEFTTPVAEL